MNDRFKAIPSVYLLMYDTEGRVLLERRQNTGYCDGMYGIGAAGHVDGNEPLTAAMVREAKEEIGIDVDPLKLSLAHTMHRIQEDERLDFFFRLMEWGGEVTNMEPEKCDDLSWFAVDDLPENTIPYVRQVIESVNRGEIYGEFGWEKKNS